MNSHRPWNALTQWIRATSWLQRATLGLTAVGVAGCVYAAAYLLGFDIHVPGLSSPTATPAGATTPSRGEPARAARPVEATAPTGTLGQATRRASTRPASRDERSVSPTTPAVQPSPRPAPAPVVTTATPAPPAVAPPPTSAPALPAAPPSPTVSTDIPPVMPPAPLPPVPTVPETLLPPPPTAVDLPPPLPPLPIPLLPPLGPLPPLSPLVPPLLPPPPGVPILP